ncbi:MAG TPA: ABC transporter ATP-binding protein [Candidatus Mediterraneibacter avicola]|nr:ABC transporter ATP-binding protein [Candidatus Mediterraneibacter avicola]
MNAILEVRDLCKTYIVNKRQNNVLKNINLTINSGEMVAVMGPSGSGKSTLLYTVSGMDEPSAGQVIFDGKELSGLNAKDLAKIRLDDMGFIFQQMYMLRNLSIGDNILLPAFQSKIPGRSRKDKVRRGQKLMRRLGIIEIAENDVNEVSGGQLQRACICRSMINSPKMLFADEPTGALNRASSDGVISELAGLNRDGTTILLVTHDVKVASSCSRVLYLVDGSISGQYNLDQEKPGADSRERERALSSWLMDMGW